jgi:multisubunit Na+/H+ antiporter MnhB subunit
MTRTAIVLGIALLCAAMGYAVLDTAPAPGLQPAVAAALPASGVTNPVTGVLLDFRGFDTFLEVAIVALAVAGVAALAPQEAAPPPLTGPVARGAAAVLAPAIVLFAGYLLWSGSSRPGGAFQAGATLAGALILLDVLGGPSPTWRDGAARRLGAAAAPMAFLLVGLATMATGRGFLDYATPTAAYATILAIESVATVSIAFSLAALFAVRPAAKPAT